MTLQRLGFIGAGGMTETILTTLAETLNDRLELLSVLVLPEFADLAKDLLDRTSERIAAATRLHTNLEQYLADTPELVVECAGHVAVREYGREILRAGIDFLAVSTGAFADDAFRLQIEAAANAGQAKLILSSGAIGGIDVLGAARLSGLQEVT
jgi:aspartate dehydrogenase